MYKEIDLNVFPPERETALKNIYRYNAFDTMLYRANLWTHTHRMLWMLEEILPIAQTYFKIDPEKTRILALVHDDAEIITGDIQAGHKAHMSAEELAEVGHGEEKAIVELSQQYPKTVHGYSYEELLLHAKEKDCIEAQLVWYVDKLDSICETTHDIYAGNLSLFRSFLYYSCLIPTASKKFPQLTELLSSKKSPLLIFDYRSDEPYVKAENFKIFSKPFTKESLQVQSDFPFYDEWKKIVLKRGGEEGLQWLMEQKEFLN